MLAGAFLLAGLLPLTLLALPNPPQYQEIERMEERGAYLRNGDTLFRLYPHPKEIEEFPGESAVAGPDSVLLVRSRQYDELGRYRLETFTGTEVQESEALETKRFIDENRILHLVPADGLDAGRYVFESVEDSMYGEPEYYYFSVSGGS